MSLLLFVLGALFNHSNIEGGKLFGEVILDYFNISLPVVLFSILFMIAAVIIGRKYKTHLFAKIGVILSQIFLVIYGVTIIISGIISLLNLLF
ncbi:hypothetical protein [Gracilibacillus xinjiangensis]|uniref:Uncharacterized protein n=1 Tax=Gracilibacillus xinjiangensis TaxID=1193282 RepID=A0ABV8WT30_9BACI